jgi:YfiH family protein
MTLPGLVISRGAGSFTVPLFEDMGLRASWTTREHDLGFEARGRRAALRRLGIDARRLVCPSQVHADRVAAVDRKDRGCGARSRRTALQGTDALITDAAGTILSGLTADCLPVFLAASACESRRAAGLIHAGWRGLRLGIVARTVMKRTREYGVAPSALVAVLGPAIRPCCYEVGEDFLSVFPASAGRRNGKVFLDLAAEAALQLTAAGVSPDRIFDSRSCTCCSDSLFYSYRREKEEAGRSLSTLELLDAPGGSSSGPLAGARKTC